MLYNWISIPVYLLVFKLITTALLIISVYYSYNDRLETILMSHGGVIDGEVEVVNVYDCMNTIIQMNGSVHTVTFDSYYNTPTDEWNTVCCNVYVRCVIPGVPYRPAVDYIVLYNN